MATYTQDGFVVSMSVHEASYLKKGQTHVSIHNQGNVATSKLPVPAGAQINHAGETQTHYITAAPEAETAAAVRQMLLDKGWKPYGKAEKTMYFKWNAVHLLADVRSFDNQPGKTFITYSTELMSADLPVPADADDPLHRLDEGVAFPTRWQRGRQAIHLLQRRAGQARLQAHDQTDRRKTGGRRVPQRRKGHGYA